MPCQVDTVYPFAGHWTPLGTASGAFCLRQDGPDRVLGTHGTGDVVGIVNRDGTLYLSEEYAPVTVRSLRVAGDTLTQQALARADGTVTERLRWVRDAAPAPLPEQRGEVTD